MSLDLGLLYFVAGIATGCTIALLLLYRYYARLIFFGRKDNVKKIWNQFVGMMEPLNARLKKEGGFPEDFDRHLWDDIVFNSAIHVYAEALNCYQFRQLEASVAMCRNAIDSATYLGITTIREESLTSHKFREISSELKGRLWRWENLERFARQFELLDEHDLNIVRIIRKQGSFSSHIASSQDTEFRKWNELYRDEFKQWENKVRKEAGGKSSIDSPTTVSVLRDIPPPPSTEGFKIWTEPEEAWMVLQVTGYCLAIIIANYFTKTNTLSDAPLALERPKQD
jgi:hypothetical protein